MGLPTNASNASRDNPESISIQEALTAGQCFKTSSRVFASIEAARQAVIFENGLRPF